MSWTRLSGPPPWTLEVSRHGSHQLRWGLIDVAGDELLYRLGRECDTAPGEEIVDRLTQLPESMKLTKLLDGTSFVSSALFGGQQGEARVPVSLSQTGGHSPEMALAPRTRFWPVGWCPVQHAGGSGSRKAPVTSRSVAPQIVFRIAQFVQRKWRPCAR